MDLGFEGSIHFSQSLGLDSSLSFPLLVLMRGHDRSLSPIHEFACILLETLNLFLEVLDPIEKVLSVLDLVLGFVVDASDAGKNELVILLWNETKVGMHYCERN